MAISRPPPWRTMRSAASLDSSRPATRSVSINSRISAGVVSASVLRLRAPTLLTRMSSRPCSASMRAKACAMAASSATSKASACASSPSRLSASAAASAAGIAAVDEHARATAGQRPRDAQTQPTGRSGHQRDLAAEFEVAQIRQGIHVIRLWLGTGTGKKRRACWIAGSPRPGPRGSGFAGPQRRPEGGAQRGVGPLIRGIPGPSAAAAAPATSRNTPARSPPATAA